MSGKRATNFRQGDLAEAFGTVLIQGFALIAPVPRTEDVGLDVVATILHQRDSYTASPENSFYIQIKSKSLRQIPYNKEEVKWLMELELPLFIASVDVSQSRLDLFACHRLTQAFIEQIEHSRIEIHLDPIDERDAEPTTRKLYVGPPVYSWTVSEIADSNFLERSYQILKPHLETSKRNLELRRSGRYEELRWTTSEPPVLAHVTMMAGSPSGDDIRGLANLAMPYLIACLMESKGTGESALGQYIEQVIDEMQRLGATQDPLFPVIKNLGQNK
jgi:hypothetical protein